MPLIPNHSPLRLELKNAFNLASGISHSRTNLLVRISSGDLSGCGEVAIVPYYGMSMERLGAELDRCASQLGSDEFLIEDIMDRLESPGTGFSAPVRCGIDLALHDLVGKRLGAPLYRIFGLNPDRIAETSFTIAIDEPKLMAQRAKEAALPVLKIKLGRSNDLEIVRAIREATDARLRLDANGGWSRERAAELIPELMELGIELIEQPLSKDDPEGCAWLRSKVKAPIFADESLQSERDLSALRPGIDGVVVKLAKSGGLRGAIRLIHAARALDLKVMLSCMIESSLGVTAAAHIAPLADHVDLDGPLLIENDPFEGLKYGGAKIRLPSRAGIGVLEQGESMR